MTDSNVSKIPVGNELEASQVEGAAGGALCSADEIVGITESLIQAYENLVGFTSHVIGRVAGE